MQREGIIEKNLTHGILDPMYPRLLTLREAARRLGLTVWGMRNVSGRTHSLCNFQTGARYTLTRKTLRFHQSQQEPSAIMALRSRTREKMIAALLEHGTVTGASQALNISRMSFFRSLQEADFQLEYNKRGEHSLKMQSRASEILRGGCRGLASDMSDTEAHPGARVSAASRLLTSPLEPLKLRS